MKLNKVEIHNFLSIKKAQVDFESCGNLVRIVGHNFDTTPCSSNGAGKSSIIEAVMFAMFGKTIRKTNDKSLQNYHTKGKCRVVLTVNGNTVIERTKKPPKLVVTVDGENCSKDSLQETQKYLEKVLNINHNVFLASIVFGQQNKINFITATPEEKRSIIQNFLSVGDLFRNRSTIKSIKSRYLSEKKLNLTLHDDGMKKVERLKNRLKELRKVKKDGKKILSSEKATFIFSHSFSEIQELERQAHEKDLEVEQALSARDILRLKIKQTSDLVEKLSSAKCDHCGFISRDSYATRKNSKKSIEDWKEQERQMRKVVTRLSKDLDKISVPVKSSDFEFIERLKTTETEIGLINKEIRRERTRVKKYGTLSTNAQKGYDLMKFWEHAFSEAGLIKYVIRNILKYFNERCNSYLSTLTKGNFVIKFDDSLDEKIYNDGVEAYFDSLSGGEKKRVGLAVMLGLNDLLLLTGKDRSNIIFFDEVADSLDSDGVKGLIELIHQLTKHKKLFLITHNDYLTALIDEYSETLTVTKRNNITKITK